MIKTPVGFAKIDQRSLLVHGDPDIEDPAAADNLILLEAAVCLRGRTIRAILLRVESNFSTYDVRSIEPEFASRIERVRQCYALPGEEHHDEFSTSNLLTIRESGRATVIS